MVKIAKSGKETQKIAKKLTEEILAFRFNGRSENKIRVSERGGVYFGNKALVVCLQGNLGAGKTVFVKGFARALGIKENITSPTFVIIKKFRIPNRKPKTSFKNLIHIDAYRLRGAKDILDLGWKELVNNSKNIILVEWAENIRKIIPTRAIWVMFKIIGENEREIKINLSRKERN
jgi:tRNA threonylcarbamoyladenosine biosynthesis protein TsaE